MTKIVTVAEMKALDAAADRAGVTFAQLMDNAGRAVAEAVLARLGDDLERHKIVALCGKGNNGGDGLVAAHYLSNAGARVAVYLVQAPDESDFKIKRLREKSVFVVDAENDQRWRVLRNLLGGATVVIDAVFGTGVRFPLTGPSADLLRQAGLALREREPRPFVVAVDCPSGLDCDTGALDPLALPADLTVTFAAAKRGHFAFPGVEARGELLVADIGIPTDLPEWRAVRVELATPETVKALLPQRPRDAHKGTFGRALIVAGSVNFTGAAYLAGVAAYRLGAGLVTLALPQTIHPVVAAQLPEATWLVLPEERGFIAEPAADRLRAELSNYTALLFGCGFGLEKTTGAFVRRLLEHGNLPPLVVDADGLRLLAQLPDWPRALPANSVLTPHPGEMAALTGVDKNVLQSDRIGQAQKFAAEWGHVVVLKGAFTVVAAPDGRATVQPFATAALARAGTGDALAGAIVGLRAQGLPAYEAAVAGAYLHGRAGELAAAEMGTTASVLAGDVLGQLARAIVEVGAC
ncbi:MAG: NAD(P)H-hydrate dehydratase [Anaerolineales bacterium]|nr:NAD(P)H-hydrate dehydratase [Anaerolineales bacterium]